MNGLAKLSLLAIIPASALIDCSTSNSECKLGLCYQTSPHATMSMDTPTESCINPATGDRTVSRKPDANDGIIDVKVEESNGKMVDINNYKQELMATCTGPVNITIGTKSAQINFFDPATMFCKQECSTGGALSGAGVGTYRLAGGANWKTEAGTCASTKERSGTQYTAKEVCQSGTAKDDGECNHPYGTEIGGTTELKAGHCTGGLSFTKTDTESGVETEYCGCATYEDCIGPNLKLMQGEVRFDCNASDGVITAHGETYAANECIARQVNTTNASATDVNLLPLTGDAANVSGLTDNTANTVRRRMRRARR